MVKSKFESLIGFAMKSGNLVAGGGLCLSKISAGRLRLLIITEDVGDNTRKKMINKCVSHDVEYRIFGKAGELSQMTGKQDKGVFGIIDKGFAENICKEIDDIQSEGEVTYGDQSI